MVGSRRKHSAPLAHLSPLAAAALGLSAACSPAAPGPPSRAAAPPAAPPNAAPPSTASSPEAPSGLGPFVPLPSPVGPLELSAWKVRTFRKGVVGYADLEDRARCPEAEGVSPSCSEAFFAPFAGKAGERGGWARRPGAGSAGPWKRLEGGGRYAGLFAGYRAAYGVSALLDAVDAIDERGVTSFSLPEPLKVSEVLGLVETSEGLALLGAVIDPMGLTRRVIVAPLELSAGRARLGEVKPLPWAITASVNDAVSARESKLRPILSPSPFLALNKDGEPTSTLQVAFYEPSGPLKRSLPPPEIPGEPISGSWGDASPAIEDGGVAKRAVVVTLDRSGKLLGEKVFPPGKWRSPLPPLPDEPTPKGPVAGPPQPSSFEPDPWGPPRPPITGRAAQWLEATGFDTGSREGAVAYVEGHATFLQRIDALGQPKGEREQVSGMVERGAPLVGLEAGWVQVSPVGRLFHLVQLTGGSSRFSFTEPLVAPSEPCALPAGPRSVEIWALDRPLPEGNTPRLFRATLEVGSDPPAAWREVEGFSSDGVSRLTTLVAVERVMGGYQLYGEAPSGAQVKIRLGDDGGWGTPTRPPLPPLSRRQLLERAREASPRCQGAIATGPRQAVLLCEPEGEPTVDRLGTRLLRW